MEEINLEMCLPEHMVVTDVDDVLYRIGLCLTSDKEEPKRLFIDNPILVFIITIMFMIEKVVTCCLSEDNELVFQILGSIGHFLGIRVHFDFSFILCSILSIVSQVINYWNYKQRIFPTYLRLFRMISGVIPPKALGLSDPEEVVRLCRRAAIRFSFLRYHNAYWLPLFTTSFSLTLYYNNTTFFEILMYGIPNTILFNLWGRFFWNIFFYQFLIFHFLCSYLIIKIKALNASAEQMIANQKLIRIRELIRSYHSIAVEINEYNVSYWSKFLFNFWLTFGLIVVILLYTVVFVPMPFIIEFVVVYVLIAYITSFLMLIFKASSVNQSANSSYQKISSLFVFYLGHNSHTKKSGLFTKFKVFYDS